MRKEIEYYLPHFDSNIIDRGIKALKDSENYPRGKYTVIPEGKRFKKK